MYYSQQIRVIGGVVADLEEKQTRGGLLYTFAVAVTKRYPNKEGGFSERTEYFDVQSWTPNDRLLERLMKYVKKGGNVDVSLEKVTSTYGDGKRHTAFRLISIDLVAMPRGEMTELPKPEQASGRNPFPNPS